VPVCNIVTVTVVDFWFNVKSSQCSWCNNFNKENKTSGSVISRIPQL